MGRIAARKAIAAAQGGTNDEPARISLPLYEDSLGGLAPQCDASLSPDFYFSNQLTPADIEKYGVVQ